MTLSVPALQGTRAGMRAAEERIRELFQPTDSDRVGVELEMFPQHANPSVLGPVKSSPGLLPLESMGAGLSGHLSL